MRRELKLAAILAFIVAIFIPYTALAAETSGGTDLVAARGASEQQLLVLGIDPTDAVFQVGARNYAGPNCPGSDWDCTTASTVVQIGSGSGFSISEFQCTPAGPGTLPPDTCVVVQVNTTGLNFAQCVEHSSANPVTQTCSITQTNISGTNRSFVDQRIVQSQPDGTQTGNQIATVHQTNATGANESAVAQTLIQNQSKQINGAAGTITQKQEAHQRAEVCQGGASPCFTNSSGRNLSGVAQTNIQNLKIGFEEGTSGAITQQQNTDFTTPKSLAVVIQNSVDKTNDSGLLHFNRQFATVHNGEADDDEANNHDGFIGTVTQQQGNGSLCPDAGVCGFVFQNSTGVQRAFERQEEVQRLKAPLGADQTQFGPLFCCATQTGDNAGNVNNITQIKNQFATGTFQQGNIQGHCLSSANACSVNQRLTQQGTTQTNSCTGSNCNPTISCTTGGETPGTICTPGTAPGPLPAPCPPACIDTIGALPLWHDAGAAAV